MNDCRRKRGEEKSLNSRECQPAEETEKWPFGRRKDRRFLKYKERNSLKKRK